MMLWAMLAAPLMAGNDLRTMSEDTRLLLTDPSIWIIQRLHRWNTFALATPLPR